MAIEILHYGDDWLAVDKPPGWVVHRTRGASPERVMLQTLRDQLGQSVFPVHRLDGGACGVILFGLSSEAACRLQFTLASPACIKKYQVLIRGWLETKVDIHKPLPKDLSGALKPAKSLFQPLANFEVLQPVGRYQTARYSLCEVVLEQGRRHQIRRHAAHMRHPVVGDSRYGDLKHNHFLQQHTGWAFLWLHAHFMELDGRQIQSQTGPPWLRLGEPVSKFHL